MKSKRHYFHLFLLVALIILGGKWAETDEAAGMALSSAAFLTLIYAYLFGLFDAEIS